MKTPPTRPILSPTPSGLGGRPAEPPMHPSAYPIPRQPIFILQALALSLATTGCFNPLVTLETDDAATDGATEASTTDEMTTTEPDSGSGDGLTPVCGNGVVEGDELCDDGMNDGSYGGCNADCSAPGPFCGDGVVNGEEPCDDGDDVDGNGCNVDCVVSGTVLWTVTYDGRAHGIDTPHGVVFDSEGNVIASGTVNAGDEGRGWLRKYSAEGASQWTLEITGPTAPTSTGPIAALLNGDTVLGGSQGPGGPMKDAWIRRYSDVGEVVWTQTYASAQGGWDSVRDVDVDLDGNIYALFAEIQLPTDPNERTFVRKYTPEGTELWSEFYDQDIELEDLATDDQGRFVVMGRSSDNDPWIQQSTSEGTEIWSRLIDNGGVSTTMALSVNSGGMMALAVSASDGPHIILMTPEGEEANGPSLHPEGLLTATYAIKLEDSGALIAGGTTVTGVDDAHGWISKYDPNGTELWTNTYDAEYDSAYSWDGIVAVDTDALGNVVAIGRIHDSANSLSNIWLTKYAP